MFNVLSRLSRFLRAVATRQDRNAFGHIFSMLALLFLSSSSFGQVPTPPEIDFFSLPDHVVTNIPGYFVSGRVEPGHSLSVALNGAEVDASRAITSDRDAFFLQFPLLVGSNSVSVKVIGPGGDLVRAATTNVDLDPSYTTAGHELLYVNSIPVGCDFGPCFDGTLVIDLTSSSYLGAIPGQHILGASPGAAQLYAASRDILSSSSHIVVGQLPFTSEMLSSSAFAISPNGRDLFHASEVVSAGAVQNLIVDISTGSAWSGRMTASPSITPDASALYFGASVNRLDLDSGELSDAAIRAHFQGDLLALGRDRVLVSEYSFASGSLDIYDGQTKVAEFFRIGDFAAEAVDLGDGLVAVGSAGNPVFQDGRLSLFDLESLALVAQVSLPLANNVAASRGTGALYATSRDHVGVAEFDRQLGLTRSFLIGLAGADVNSDQLAGLVSVSPLACDFDLSGHVSFADFLLLATGYGAPGGWGAGDCDLDQRVSFSDFLALASAYERTVLAPALPLPSAIFSSSVAAVVPEPACGLSVWVSSLVCLRRWRRPRRPSSAGRLELLESRAVLTNQAGSVLSFDGLDDFARVADHPAVDLGVAGDFTLEATINVKSPAIDSNQLLFYKPSGYGVFFNRNGLFAELSPNSFQRLQLFRPGSLTAGWHHVAVVFDNEFSSDSDKFSLYFDGSLVASTSSFEVTPGINNSTSPLYVGANFGAVAFAGEMDEVRLSRSVRYAADGYEVPTEVFSVDSETLALWHFDEPSEATSFVDQSTNALGLTAFNGVHTQSLPKDLVAPAIVSIDRVFPGQQLTNVNSAIYRVAFSESVINVSTDSFVVEDKRGSLTGEFVKEVSSSNGAVIDVTVDLGSGDGELGLNVFGLLSRIVDGAGNSLAGEFQGPTYIIDRTAPSVSIRSLTTFDRLPQLTGQIDDTEATIQVSLNDHTYPVVNLIDGVWMLQVTDALSPGTYDIVITATDRVGNIGTDSTENELVVDRRPADFDSNGVIDSNDINLLFAALSDPIAQLVFDLNSDDVVNRTDLDVLVRDVLKTTYGDIDLDQDIDFGDFLLLSGGFGKSGGWGSGDTDGDFDVDFADFLVLSRGYDRPV